MAKKDKIIPIPIEAVYTDAIKYAVDSFRDGNSEQEIGRELKITYTLLSDANIQLVLHKASKHIGEQFSRESGSVVALHVTRYDEEIKRAMNNTYEGLSDEDFEDQGPTDIMKWRRKMRIDALNQALDIMLQKERALQLHHKDTQVKIFNKLNAKVKEKKIMFDLKTLTLEEKIDFLNLIQRAKKSESEVMSIIMSQSKNEEVEDISYEDVINSNIDKIKNLPIVPIKVKAQKGLDDITKKIHQRLAIRAAIDFKNKGGQNGGPKEIDYTEI
jgi:hypothetical protein